VPHFAPANTATPSYTLPFMPSQTWIGMGTEDASQTCLTVDTFVLTPYGEKPIRDISAGDEVLTMGLDGHLEVTQVMTVGKPHREQVYDIYGSGGVHIRATEFHRFAVERWHSTYATREFVDVRDITKGDVIVSKTHKRVTVERIERGDKEMVTNLTTLSGSYLISQDGIVSKDASDPFTAEHIYVFY